MAEPNSLKKGDRVSVDWSLEPKTGVVDEVIKDGEGARIKFDEPGWRVLGFPNTMLTKITENP